MPSARRWRASVAPTPGSVVIGSASSCSGAWKPRGLGHSFWTTPAKPGCIRVKVATGTEHRTRSGRHGYRTTASMPPLDACRSSIVPPSSSTRRFEIASPSPDPVPFPPARSGRTHARARPRSAQAPDRPRAAPDREAETETVEPRGDASIAFARRLSRTCSTRPLTDRDGRAVADGSEARRRAPRRRASTDSTRRATTSPSLTSVAAPASASARASASSSSTSRERRSTSAIAAAVSPFSSLSRRAVNGVRSSCDASATN